jgi:hypothetical protein
MEFSDEVYMLLEHSEEHDEAFHDRGALAVLSVPYIQNA